MRTIIPLIIISTATYVSLAKGGGGLLKIRRMFVGHSSEDTSLGKTEQLPLRRIVCSNSVPSYSQSIRWPDFFSRVPCTEIHGLSRLPAAHGALATSAAQALGAAPATHEVSAFHFLSAVSAAFRSRAMSQSSASGEVEVPRNFDVVQCRSEDARSLFRSMVSNFSCPDEKKQRWSVAVRNKWYEIKKRQMGREAMMQGQLLPVLAMKDGTPCASALYSDAYMNSDPILGNTFLLYSIIANEGDRCKGAGAAILCHLIRNSKNGKLEFSPLKFTTIKDAPDLDRYYESFGCREVSNIFTRALWTIKEGFVPFACSDPNPRKCKQYYDEDFDADSYFESQDLKKAAEMDPAEDLDFFEGFKDPRSPFS